MPRRGDLRSILVLGSGPIVIGQACEFDYSGTQACRALRREGYRVVLVNSNPATIMTDPEFADATYVEPLVPEIVEKIVERERPDALLPTVGGQTGINLAIALDERGVLGRYDVEVLGAGIEALRLGEDRLLFKQAMQEVGLAVPRSGYAGSLDEARAIAGAIGFPVIVRPSFTLGGEGGGVAYNREELEEVAAGALQASPAHRVLVEESVLGWKEFELEVMRDTADNAIVVCSVENFDAMGVHTGDSITVAPQQTLSDRDYQAMRDDAFKVIRRVGVATGGSNIQFAVHPRTGERVVIEMNPRVSRSSALASKATGFPIAKIAALLAVGYTLDEVANEITGKTRAAFEPTLDYTVVKIPRWAFEKFPEAAPTLGTAMKSVGEVMAIGGTFREALMKGLASLELDGGLAARERRVSDPVRLRRLLSEPNWERLFAVFAALRQGWTVEEVAQISHINPWFLREIREVVELEAELACWDLPSAPLALLRRAKGDGLTDARIAALLTCKEADLAASGARRRAAHLQARGHLRRRVPGHDALPLLDLRRRGRERADGAQEGRHPRLRPQPHRPGDRVRLLLRPRRLRVARAGDRGGDGQLQPRDRLDRLRHLRPPLLRAADLGARPRRRRARAAGGGDRAARRPDAAQARPRPRGRGGADLGTPPDAIDLAEDRERFGALLRREGIRQPDHGTARSHAEALVAARSIGFPVVVRPSYVLGGRAMAVCYDEATLAAYMRRAAEVSEGHPVLLDRFLEDAFELDLDLLADGRRAVVAGILEHIEEAASTPATRRRCCRLNKVSREHLDEMRDIARRLALGSAS